LKTIARRILESEDVIGGINYSHIPKCLKKHSRNYPRRKENKNKYVNVGHYISLAEKQNTNYVLNIKPIQKSWD
jgi:hypothetical protein